MQVKNKKKSNDNNGSKAVRVLWTIFAIGIACVILFFFLVAKGLFGTMPSFEELENPQTNLATEIISCDGKVLGTYYIENRSNVYYSDLSPYLPQALISVEDERFEQHSGIDSKSLFTRLTDALNAGDYKSASRLQVEMYDKVEELKHLYDAYERNLI